jgi:uncharacterized protein
MISFFYLFLAGIIGGLISGLVGIGGGVVYVFIIPIALQVLGVPLNEVPQYTIANSIFGIVFAAGVSSWLNHKDKNFYLKEVFIISSLGIISSILTLKYIVNTHFYSVLEFNLILIILLCYMLYNTLLSAKKVYITPLSDLRKWKLAGVGLACGAVSALSGMGGGIIIIPALNTLMKVDIKKASSISLGVITIMSVFMTYFNLFAEPKLDHPINYSSGYIIFPVAMALCPGVLIGSPVGNRLAKKLTSTNISYIYAFFLIIVILRKIIELAHLL